MPSGNCVIPSSRHDAGNSRFSQFINKKILNELMKLVNNFFLEIFHCLQLQKTKHFRYWNCFRTVVIGSGGTYLVPCCRICFSYPLNSSVHSSTNCSHLNIAKHTDQKQSIIFYLLSTICCTQWKDL